jgi:hypothetical protein
MTASRGMTSGLVFRLNRLGNRVLKLISVAKQERADAVVFARDLRDRIVVLETKVTQGQAIAQDHEARISALEGGG